MPSNDTAIWILCGTFVGFLLLRFPVAMVLVLSSIATLWYLGMPIVVAAQQTIQGINIFSLLAIPFFIMTGQLLGAGGLANRIVAFANLFVGRLPGGLSIVNSVACMFFGVFTGIFSSMFIAPVALMYIRRRWPTHGGARTASVPAARPASAPARQRPVAADRD